MNYLTAEEVIQTNVYVLMQYQTKKADRHEVRSYAAIREVLQRTEQAEGDVYQKADVLMQELVTRHPFASGNRRTAFALAKRFVLRNDSFFAIIESPNNAAQMLGIREGFYNVMDIAEWIKNGQIKDFNKEAHRRGNTGTG